MDGQAYMANERIARLKQMLEKRPDDSRILFGLAAEYERESMWEDVVSQLRAYLAIADDEGNAWGRLGHALRELGRPEEAVEAYLQGVRAAQRHAHPTMVMEFEESIAELGPT
jgi:tetratricopeptide (TPR) repeat protein